MNNDHKQVKYPARWMWILGFWGFSGLSYFETGDTSKLFSLAFFAFFAYYFLNKITSQRQDERMMENHKKATILAGKIPLLALFVIGIISINFSVPSVFFILCGVIGLAGYVLTYVGTFIYLERYT